MRSATAKRLRSSWLLFACALGAAAIAAAACSGSKSKSAAGSPTPSPIVFNPTSCQVVWVTDQTAPNVIDYYVVDAPVSVWAAGTTTAGFFQGDPSGATDVTGAYVRGFDVATQTRQAAMVATSGTFQISLASTNPIGAGQPVSELDSTPQDYFLLATNGALTVDEGASGTGSFDGQWSKPQDPNVTHGVGTVTVMFDGSSLIMGQSFSYALCYEKTAFAPQTLEQLLADVGARASAAR